MALSADLIHRWLTYIDKCLECAIQSSCEEESHKSCTWHFDYCFLVKMYASYSLSVFTYLQIGQQLSASTQQVNHLPACIRNNALYRSSNWYSELPVSSQAGVLWFMKLLCPDVTAAQWEMICTDRSTDQMRSLKPELPHLESLQTLTIDSVQKRRITEAVGTRHHLFCSEMRQAERCPLKDPIRTPLFLLCAKIPHLSFRMPINQCMASIQYHWGTINGLLVWNRITQSRSVEVNSR